MRSTLLSLSFLVCVGSAEAQYNTKKYIKRNRKAATMTCGNSTIYSRGLLVEGAKVFSGNSDGSMYYYNTEKEKVQLLFKLDGFVEMRDIERSGDFLIGIQSGDDGKLVRLNMNGSAKIIEKPEWKGLFIDGIDMIENRGFLMGDPVDGFFSLYHTNDGGKNWLPCKGKVQAEKGEAGFSSSGTNVQLLNDSTYAFISGGEKSQFYISKDNGKSWESVLLPFYPGESSGAFSMHFSTDQTGVIVGGDYVNSDLMLNTAYFTRDGGKSWYNSIHSPRGYRSCVFEKNGVYYTSGRNGIDFSLDNGENWIPFADGPYYSLGANEAQLVATTKEGKIQLFDLISPDTKN